MTRMIGYWLGVFLLGVVSFFIFMGVGEGVGLGAAFLAVASFLFVCQFLLSRGHVDAHRDDWHTMVGLAAPLFLSTLLVAVLERPEVFFVQGVPLSASAGVGIYAGAVAAAFAARRTASRPL